MRVLVVAASKHGATLDIAELIAGTLADAGVEAVVQAPEDVASVDDYDAAIVGSAVYIGRWMSSARQFVERNAIALGNLPVWLFSSGPAGDPPLPAGDPADVAELKRLTHAREHRVFAGRIDRQALAFGEKIVVSAVHAPSGDFRSPAEIKGWAAGIAWSLREPVLVG